MYDYIVVGNGHPASRSPKLIPAGAVWDLENPYYFEGELPSRLSYGTAWWLVQGRTQSHTGWEGNFRPWGNGGGPFIGHYHPRGVERPPQILRAKAQNGTFQGGLYETAPEDDPGVVVLREAIRLAHETDEGRVTRDLLAAIPQSESGGLNRLHKAALEQLLKLLEGSSHFHTQEGDTQSWGIAEAAVEAANQDIEELRSRVRSRLDGGAGLAAST